MKVGDLVQHFLTEQIGVVITIHNVSDLPPEIQAPVQVLWTTQGLSLFGPGGKEWCDSRSLEALNESR